MSEIVEIGKDTVDITVVDNNITLDVTTSTVSLTAASVGPQGIQGVTGATGPANVLSVGSVTSAGAASASITGTSPSQVLNLVLPKGDTGSDGIVAQESAPANTNILWLDTDEPAALTIEPSQVTNTAFTLSNYRNINYVANNALDTVYRPLCIGFRLISNGVHPFVIFVPNTNFTVSNITTVSSTATADVGGTTVRRMGLYTYNSTTDAYTLVARTANDATLWTANSTVYTRALATAGGYPSTYELVSGTTYAIACVAYNTGGTFGSVSLQAFNGNNNGGLSGLVPHFTSVLTGQTDLSTSGTASVSTQGMFFSRLT
jgi:hypothetical protein